MPSIDRDTERPSHETTPGIYRLLFLDLDGTLVGKDDRVSPRTLAALDTAQAAGCTVVICTARNRYTVEPIAAQWRGHGYAVLSNGAIIAEWDTGKILHKIALAPAVAQWFARTAHSLESSPLLFGVHSDEDGGQRVYTDIRFPHPEAYVRRNGHRFVYRDDLETRNGLSPVGMAVYGSRSLVEAMVARCRETFGSEVSAFPSFDPKYDCWCAFLNSGQADKALGAARVAEMRGVPREQTMAVGDHLNDLTLLRWAGLGVCMGDGHEDARTCAAHVTGTLAEDGAAQAIEKFVLGRV